MFEHYIILEYSIYRFAVNQVTTEIYLSSENKSSVYGKNNSLMQGIYVYISSVFRFNAKELNNIRSYYISFEILIFTAYQVDVNLGVRVHVKSSQVYLDSLKIITTHVSTTRGTNPSDSKASKTRSFELLIGVTVYRSTGRSLAQRGS